MEIFEKAFGKRKPENLKRRTFRNILSGFKSNYLHDYQKAISDYSVKDFQSALKNINSTIKRSDINDWRHYAFRANIYEEKGNFKEAIIDYERAISYSLDDMEVYALYHQIGFCYLSIENNQKAKDFFSWSLDLKLQHPNYGHNPDQEGMDMGVLLGVPLRKIYNNIGNANYRLENISDSISNCLAAINEDKNYSFPYFLLGQIYAHKKDVENSKKYFKKSAELGHSLGLQYFKKLEEMKKNQSVSDNLKNKTFNGTNFNNWFYLDSLEQANSIGYPYANACFEIEDNILLAHGTKNDESPKEFIRNNKNNIFSIDEAIKPLNFKGKKVFYAKKTGENFVSEPQKINLDFVYKSSSHLRFENGKIINELQDEANRAIKVEPNINGCKGYNIDDGEGFIVTLYNLDGKHPIWSDNVQMSPKPMKIVSQSAEKIVLRGYSMQAMSPFGWVDFSGDDYGLSIFIKNNQVDKCILHMHERNVNIEYLKAGNEIEENDIEKIQTFINKFKHLSITEKMVILQNADELNNRACKFLQSNELDNAIKYYDKALSVFPINDDALKNIILCYEKIRDFDKSENYKKILNYVEKINFKM